MRRRLITTGLLVGGLALAAAACGTSDPQVQARQTGDTTATTAAPTTTAAHLQSPALLMHQLDHLLSLVLQLVPRTEG
jgi:hypothetical protein